MASYGEFTGEGKEGERGAGWHVLAMEEEELDAWGVGGAALGGARFSAALCVREVPLKKRTKRREKRRRKRMEK
jgi:hypothetical protein